MNLQPEELREQVEDARQRGLIEGSLVRDQHVVDLTEELRRYKAVLWALARAAAPHPLRISQTDVLAYDGNATIVTSSDPATGDLLVWPKS